MTQTQSAVTLYEKCDGCHLFVEPVECSSTGIGCTCGCTAKSHLSRKVGPYTDEEAREFTAAYLDHDPEAYFHLHRGDDADDRLDASHAATPSGRKANLLTWKTYGPLPMRERFTS